jgi:hypothetical protein
MVPAAAPQVPVAVAVAVAQPAWAANGKAAPVTDMER